ncbi:MAG: DUF58 domain-containing protein [Planctomycetaceae bacterium]|nr:DUF58 domain-containing protein [Planctomycetaceae bacterium]
MSMNRPAQLDRLAELEGLALAARGLCAGILEEPPSRLPVGGTELTGYRDYSPGDDHRHVDWNVCARHDELRVRLYSGRRDCHVRLLLDSSASMGLGSPSTRFEAARRIAAAVGYVAIDRQARLSVFPFSDRLLGPIGPLRGRARLGRFLRQLDALPAPEGATDFRRVAETLIRVDQSAGPVVIVSDLCDAESFQRGLEILQFAGRSARVIHLIDPAEDESLSPGDILLTDAEGGQEWEVTLTASQLRRYRKLAAEDKERARRHCSARHLPYVRVETMAPDRRLLGNIIAMRTALP